MFVVVLLVRFLVVLSFFSSYQSYVEDKLGAKTINKFWCPLCSPCPPSLGHSVTSREINSCLCLRRKFVFEIPVFAFVHAGVISWIHYETEDGFTWRHCHYVSVKRCLNLDKTLNWSMDVTLGVITNYIQFLKLHNLRSPYKIRYTHLHALLNVICFH